MADFDSGFSGDFTSPAKPPSDLTGPPYPPLPGPGSNGIGKFIIGVSPIGTIPPFDWRATIISQYANSPILTQLIENYFSYLDQTENFDSFYDNIWNIETAQGYGLDVWGRIVGVNRVLTIRVGKFFGFAEATTASADPFNQSAFYSGVTQTENYVLSDQSFRMLILAKAAANITSDSIPAINAILRMLFPNRGNAYVTDGVKYANYFGFAEAQTSSGFNQDCFYSGQTFPRMTIEYVFNFQLSPVELAIVQTSGVLPKPVGVSASVLIL
jgi:hypothetical protein